MNRNPTLTAIIYVVLGFFVASVADALIKTLTASYTISQIIFLAFLFGGTFVFIALLASNNVKALRTTHPWLHGLRILLLWPTYLCIFYALAVLPLTSFYAFVFTAPLWATFFSILILKQKTSKAHIIALITGFVGILIITRPTHFETVLFWGMMSALTGAALFAASTIVIQFINKKEHFAAFGFYGTFPIVFLMLPFALQDFVMPSGTDWLLFIMLGVMEATIQILLPIGFRRAPVPVVAPFQYTQMLWGVLFGYLFWNEIPDLWTMAGSLIIILCGLSLLKSKTP